MHRDGVKSLHRLQFHNVHDTSAAAFGFIDPENVIRGVHLVPAFAFGSTEELLGPSKARRKLDGAPNGYHDWNYYFVNMYVIYQVSSSMRLTSIIQVCRP